jgi:hypothetical protein
VVAQDCAVAVARYAGGDPPPGAERRHPRWQFLTFGTAISVIVWLLASGGFAFYVSQLGSYNCLYNKA